MRDVLLAPTIAEFLLIGCLYLHAQAVSGRSPFPSTQATAGSMASESHTTSDSEAEQELQKGTALTRRGQFSEAIPHLLAARGKVSNEYAADFNLALCYVGSGEFKNAIPLLNDLRGQGHENADVENLLAQAYVGNDQPKEALQALEKAAAISPQNEKLYLYVADACTDRQHYALALKVVDLGLRNVPQSARLHFERGIVLSDLDELDRAKDDFAFVAKSAGESEIGYVSAAQQNLLAGNLADAVKAARSGIAKNFQSPVLLTMLGEALLRLGAAPGQPEFNEAQTAIERAVAERPNDPTSQIVLGQIFLAGGRLTDAIAHLERARQMQPDRAAVYATLAKAYRRNGDEHAAEQALATLEKLNLARAEQIRSAPGDRKMSYGGGQLEQEPPKP